jgi:Uma2 family endonuclease
MSQAVLTPGGVVTATTTVSDQLWTVSDLEPLPSGRRYELLAGVLYMVAMPGWPHPLVAKNLYNLLDDWARAEKCGYVFSAQTGLYLNEHNYLDPDIVYLRPHQVPRGEGQRVQSATLAAEVISPSNFRSSREDREVRFRQLGVEEIWYVHQYPRRLVIRRLAEDGYEDSATFEVNDLVRSGVFPGLEFPLEAVWTGVGE